MEPKSIILSPNSDLTNKADSDFWWPDDILMEIICRLSDKPLHRFKCVSKGWAYLISHVCIPRIALLFPRRPLAGLYFVEAKFPPDDSIGFLSRTRDPISLYFSGDWIFDERIMPLVRQYVSLEEENEDVEDRSWVVDSAIPFGSLPFTPDFNDLLDCCNGLLLFFDTGDSFQYYVYNPFTKQSISIPLPESCAESYARCRPGYPCVYASIVFDPSKSLHYRVVRFDRVDQFVLGRRERVFLDIYHSTSRSWSRHLVNNLGPDLLEESWTRHSVYFDGSIYRLAFAWKVVKFEISEREISSGDEISASLIDLPMGVAQTGNVNMIGCIGVHMGSLCYANHWDYIVNIWSLFTEKKRESWHCYPDGPRWVMIHMINLSRVYRCVGLFREEDCPPYDEWLSPTAFHPYSNVVFLSSPLVMLSYNLDEHRIEEIRRVVKEDNDVILPGSYVSAFPYVRLLSPFDEEGNIEAYHQHHPISEA